MDRVAIVFFAMLSIIVLLALGGIYADQVVAVVRRRVPNFSYEGELFLMWGLVLVATFALGLVVMYLLLRP